MKTTQTTTLINNASPAPKEASIKSHDGRFIQSSMMKRRKKPLMNIAVDYGKRNMAAQISNISATEE